MQTKLLILISLFTYSTFAFTTTIVPTNDTIILLNKNNVEGRWIDNNNGAEKPDIYIFRDDYTFHKATDNGELIFFNIAGSYKLSNDSIKVFYQDFSRQTNKRVKVKTMYLQVISLSNDELIINKTENHRIQFMRLRRQSTH